MTNNRCKVLGFNVDLLTFHNAVLYVLEKIKKNDGLHIITINPEIIFTAEKNKELADIINNSELVIPESSGIIKALMFKRIKQEQIPGIDFSKELLKQCEKLNYSVALIGATEHVIIRTLENLKNEFPKLNIVYSHNGYFKNDDDIINEITKNNPKLILCALGSPKQELFIKKCRKIYANGIYIGIGGSFDVWAGEVRRAPLIFQKLGLEWLYRTLRQPSRIKRIYKTLPVFFVRSIIEGIKS